MKKILWKLAAVDPALMEHSLWSDRVYATIIGILIATSGVFVFVVSYDAFQYITPDGFLGWLLTLMLAILVTIFIVMLNMALINKEWVDKSQKKAKDMLLRLIIALFLSFIMGGMAVLSVFSSNIESVLEQRYKEDNALLYAEAKQKEQQNLDKMVTPYKNELESLERKYQKWRSMDLNASLSTLQHQIEFSKNELTEVLNRKKELLAKEQELMNKINSEEYKYEKASELFQCDINGRGRVEIRGKWFLCSTKSGDGHRTDAFENDMKLAEETLKLTWEQQKKVEESLKNQIKKKQDLQKKIQDLQREVDKVKDREMKLERLKEEIKEAKVKWKSEQVKHEKYKKELYEQVEQDPEFKPRRDDLLARFQALFTLLQDDDESTGVLFGTLLVLMGIMFFELVPVVVKFMYMPKSQYAMIQREFMDIEESLNHFRNSQKCPTYD